MNINRSEQTPPRREAFTLIELLVVIAIISLLAAFFTVGTGAVKKAQYKNVARAELEVIETALENYKAKYGAYPPGNAASPMMNQLYYELSGMTTNSTGFVTLDGRSQIDYASVPLAFGVGGFVNCTKGSGEEAVVAKNFLPNLKPKQVANSVTNNSWNNNVPNTAILITSVGGPDENYKPLGVTGWNPFYYAYPGTNNPNSYDLWVDLSISGKTNRVSNWSRNVQVVQ